MSGGLDPDTSTGVVMHTGDAGAVLRGRSGREGRHGFFIGMLLLAWALCAPASAWAAAFNVSGGDWPANVSSLPAASSGGDYPPSVSMILGGETFDVSVNGSGGAR